MYAVRVKGFSKHFTINSRENQNQKLKVIRVIREKHQIIAIDKMNPAKHHFLCWKAIQLVHRPIPPVDR